MQSKRKGPSGQRGGQTTLCEVAQLDSGTGGSDHALPLQEDKPQSRRCCSAVLSLPVHRRTAPRNLQIPCLRYFAQPAPRRRKHRNNLNRASNTREGTSMTRAGTSVSCPSPPNRKGRERKEGRCRRGERCGKLRRHRGCSTSERLRAQGTRRSPSGVPSRTGRSHGGDGRGAAAASCEEELDAGHH